MFILRTGGEISIGFDIYASQPRGLDGLSSTTTLSAALVVLFLSLVIV